jgi:hypothetical protein
MKKGLGLGVLVVICLLSTGCIIRSLHPWLSDESRVESPVLVGTWTDAGEDTTMFFNLDSSSNYNVLVVSKGKEISHFSGMLHKIDTTLLLQVGPEDRTDLGAFATLPGLLLYRAVLKKNSLKLYEMNLEGFEERAEASEIPLLPDSSEKNGFVLLPTTEVLEAFVRDNLKKKDFFSSKPIYSLTNVDRPEKE